MDRDKLAKLIELSYDEYVQHGKYLDEGRKMPITLVEYKKDLFHRAKDILDRG